MAGKDIRQKVTIDTGDSAKEIAKVEAAAKDTDKAIDAVDDRELTFDTTEGFRRVRELQDQIKKLRDESVVITAELDARGVDTAAVKRELDQIDTTLDVGLDVDHGRVNTTTTAINDVFSELGNQGAATAVGISQAFNDAAEQAIAAFGPNSGVATALTALGPLGTAALGAAVGGVLYWWQQIKAEEEKAAAKVADYVEALEEASGAISEAALRQAIDNLADPKIVKAIDDVGLSWLDVADIIEGKTVPAWEEARRIQDFLFRTGVGSHESYIERLREQFGVSEEVAESMLDQAAAVRILDGALADEESGLRSAVEAHEAKQAVVARTIDQLGGYRKALDELPEEVVTQIKPFIDLSPFEAFQNALDQVGARVSSPTIGTQIINMAPGAEGPEVDRNLASWFRYNGTGDWGSSP